MGGEPDTRELTTNVNAVRKNGGRKEKGEGGRKEEEGRREEEEGGGGREDEEGGGGQDEAAGRRALGEGKGGGSESEGGGRRRTSTKGNAPDTSFGRNQARQDLWLEKETAQKRVETPPYRNHREAHKTDVGFGGARYSGFGLAQF